MLPGLNPVLVLRGLFVLLVVVGAGLFLPSFKGEVVDATVSSHAEWNSLTRQWSLDAPAYTLTDSRLINPSAWGQRAAFFGATESHTVRFELLDQASGVSLQRVERETGTDWLDGRAGFEVTLTAVFREVPPGDYLVRTRLVNPMGAIVAESSTPLLIVSTERAT